MTSRNAILSAVRAKQRYEVPLPGISLREHVAPDLSLAFSDALEAASAEVVFVRADEVWASLVRRFGQVRIAAAPFTDPTEPAERIGSDTPISTLAELDVLVCRGTVGVAENGAVWLPESHCGHRAAPFLARHLVLLVDQTAIVPTMHEAFARIDAAAEGFGAFIAGPSKTADIEQALVIGAHGPLGLTVVLAA